VMAQVITSIICRHIRWMQVRESGRSPPLVLSTQDGPIWSGEFVVSVSPGRYLIDAAPFCDVPTA